MLAALQDLLAVNQHVDHSSRVLVGICKSGMILDAGRVKDRNVSEIAGLQPASLLDIEGLGRV